MITSSLLTLAQGSPLSLAHESSHTVVHGSSHALVAYTTRRIRWCTAEVAGVPFSDSDSAPVPKFLKPGPASKIFESDSC